MDALYDVLVRFEHTAVYLALLLFFAWYPVGTSLMWIFTALIYFVRRELNVDESFYELERYPSVSVIIPAYNEEARIRQTLDGVLALDYPDFEVLVVDDCSTDNTFRRLLPYAREKRIRLVRKRRNEGKAMALNDAIPATRGELLLVMDADAVPDPGLLRALVPHFQSPRVAAVTGNPRVANRDSFLAKLQAIEFTSIVSMLRRAQRVWGRIVTMSGVVGMFRRSALLEVGLYSPQMATEDIDLTWRLQLAHWDVRYEARAVMWMNVPQSLQGLWRQRRRWALGLSQVLARHAREALRWRNRRLWPVLTEALLSITWAYVYVLLTGIWLLSYFVGYPPVGASPIPNLWGMLIGTTCLLQLGVGVLLDRKYDRHLGRYYVVAVFYPLVYWILMSVITVITTPRGWSIHRERDQVTLWKPVRE
ncbi:MAG TPA: glycosyltransferase [Candidatus Krumholzibacteria bacterium]|nr:glycosyltransferase [Candidatus Krumholzibacteria bacterium]HRX51476.1 glycosyltransferase [Candidatus Krumholzibacteria bacterium]